LEQLVFEFAPPEPPRIANFLVGRNGELIAALTRFAGGDHGETGFLLWGGPGAGKTHLLLAALALAAERGIETRFCADPQAVAADPGGAQALVAIDQVDDADALAAGRIFTLYNQLKERGGRLLVASRAPLGGLPLREDVRTRLGWGLVYEVLPLQDEEKAAALATYAAQRGFRLSSEVIDYLLRHGRRDMRSLVATLAALDRLSLAAKRPVTVPLLRQWLERGATQAGGTAGDG
jgi:DnaA family protein